SPEATSSHHTTSSIPLPSIPTAPIPTLPTVAYEPASPGRGDDAPIKGRRSN
nr:hypothetical protein [Tanacetum cinerariifolium]